MTRHHKNKNNGAIFIVIIVLAIGIYVYTQYASTHVAQNTNTTKSTDNITMSSANDSSSYAIVRGKYPQFKNASASFNKEISDAVKSAKTEQFENSKENWVARYKTATPDENISEFPTADALFSLDIDSKVIRNDNKFISVVLKMNAFTGGAHGNESINTFNYDLTKKKSVALADLIKKHNNFLQKVSEATRTFLLADLAKRAEVSESEIDTEMLNEGTSPKVENFSLFTIPKDNHILFYFEPYQVAAYVFGSSEVLVNVSNW